VSLKIQQHTIQARLAIGEKHAEKGYPVKLDYFIATHPFDPKTKTAPRHKKLTEYFEATYKTAKPKFVDIVLIDHHYEEVFFTNYMNYPGTTCNCRGDGETATRTNSEGVKSEVVCDYAKCEFRLTKGSKGIVNTCKPTGILTFIIPDAPMAGGVIKFSTHSIMSIGKINDALMNIYAIRGTLFGLKVRLKVTMVQVSIGGKTQNVPTVELEIPFSYNEIAEGAGTKIGTLMEAKAKHLAMGKLPDEKKMKEISIAAEKDAYVEGDIPSQVSDSTIDAEIVDPGQGSVDPTNSSDEEFSF
jgi:hypothetical protein